MKCKKYIVNMIAYYINICNKSLKGKMAEIQFFNVYLVLKSGAD